MCPRRPTRRGLRLLDHAVSNEDGDNGSVAILLGKKSGGFEAKADYPTFGPAGVAAARLNGDRALDLVTSADGDDAIATLLNPP